MLKLRGRKYLSPPPAIICQVYLLFDSQSYISFYSFKALNLNLSMNSLYGYIFLNELCEACECTKFIPSLYRGLHTVLHSRTAGRIQIT